MTMLLHDRQMHGVACGETVVSEDNLFGSFDGGMFNGEDLVDHVKQSIEGALNVVDGD